MESLNETLKQALDALDIPITVVDPDLRLVLINHAFVVRNEKLGFRTAGLIGLPVHEAFPLLKQGAVEGYRRIFATGKPERAEGQYVINNEPVHVAIHKYPIFADFRVSYVVAVVIDITEQHRYQEELRNSEETARALINASTESMILLDDHNIMLDMNAVAAQRLGRPIEELRGKSAAEVLPAEVIAFRKPLIEQVIRTGQAVRYQDSRAGMMFDTSMYPVLDSRRVMRRLAVFATDITERAAKEEELIRIRRGIEGASDAIGLTDVEERCALVNRAFRELFGYTAEDLNQAGGPAAIYRDRTVHDRIFGSIRDGRPWSGEVEMISRDNKRLLVDLRADSICDKQGRLIGFIGIHTDVTARAQAQAVVKETQEQYKTLFRSIPVPTYVWESIGGGDFILRDFNTAAISMTNRGVNQFLNVKASEMYADRPHILGDLRECFKQQVTLFREMAYQFRSADIEKYLQVHYVYTPPNRVLVHTVDVTERKRSERELQRIHLDLEQRIAERTETLSRQLAFDALLTAILTRFANCRTSELDDHIREVLRETSLFIGAESAFVIQTSPDLSAFNATHTWRAPDIPETLDLYRDMPRGVFAWSEEALMSRQLIMVGSLNDIPDSATAEREEYHRQGTLSLLAIPLHDREGNVSGCIGLRTITRELRWSEDDARRLKMVGDAIANALERKQAEEELWKTHRQLEATVNALPDLLFEIDQDGRILDFRAPYPELLYKPPEQFLDHSVSEVLPQEASSVIIEALAIARTEGQSRGHIYPLTLPTGRSWFELSIASKGDPHAKDTTFIILVRDVTARKQAEEDLARVNHQLSVERETLRQKNIALQEVLDRVKEGRQQVAAQIQSNLEQIVLPILGQLDSRVDSQGRSFLDLAKSSIADVMSPFVGAIESRFRQLTPSEIQICNLIRLGKGTKEIAALRNSSVQTVLKQRKLIRKKLGLDKKRANLETFLKSETFYKNDIADQEKL